MPRKTFPWPIGTMVFWYENEEKTCQEIADTLSSEEWQDYWKVNLGSEYRPTAKMTQKVLKRSGCAMRPRGAPAARNGNWGGGCTIDKAGYILVRVPGHPFANKNGYIRKHRLVMEQILGRYLKPEEVVHHIDEDPSNNEPNNLALFEHNRIHVSETMKGRVPASRIAEAHKACTFEWPKELMIRWYQIDGLTASQIASLLDRSGSAVRRKLKSFGVPLVSRPPAKLTADHQREALELPSKYRGNSRLGDRKSKRTTAHSTT